jgi:hypothetical protein
VTYCVRVFVALGIRRAKRMRPIFSSVACLVLLKFFLSSHIRLHFIKEKVAELNTCFDFFLQFLSETFLILRRTERDMINNECWSSCNVP